METTVLMSCEVLEIVDKAFKISVAQNILVLEKKMGVENWKLTDNNFMLKNGTIERTNSIADKRAESKTADTKGG
jgi:hypothetical protein